MLVCILVGLAIAIANSTVSWKLSWGLRSPTPRSWISFLNYLGVSEIHDGRGGWRCNYHDFKYSIMCLYWSKLQALGQIPTLAGTRAWFPASAGCARPQPWIMILYLASVGIFPKSLQLGSWAASAVNHDLVPCLSRSLLHDPSAGTSIISHYTPVLPVLLFERGQHLIQDKFRKRGILAKIHHTSENVASWEYCFPRYITLRKMWHLRK